MATLPFSGAPPAANENDSSALVLSTSLASAAPETDTSSLPETEIPDVATGASFVPETVIVTVLVEVNSPSVTV